MGAIKRYYEDVLCDAERAETEPEEKAIRMLDGVISKILEFVSPEERKDVYQEVAHHVLETHVKNALGTLDIKKLVIKGLFRKFGLSDMYNDWMGTSGVDQEESYEN